MRVTLNVLFNVPLEKRGAEWPVVESLCAWYHLIDAKLLKSVPRPGQAQDGSQLQLKARPQSQDYLEAFRFNDAHLEAALILAVVSPEVPGLARQQKQLHHLASQLSERLSPDNWRGLNRMLQRVPASSKKLSQSEAMTILDDATGSLMMMSGFALDGMSRDLGWRFLSLGRRLERLQFQSTVLQRALGMEGNGSLDWLLELSDCMVTYRTRYRTQSEWLPVLDLLLLDESNPRSVLFQVKGILKGLQKLALTYGACGEERLVPLKEELLGLVPETDLYCGNARLVNLLYRIKSVSEALSEQISVQFFSYTGQRSQRTRAA